MTSLSNNSSNGDPLTDDQLTDATNAVNLCNVANAVNAAHPTVDTSQLQGWKIVWNGQQTTDANYAFIALDPTEEIYAL